MRYSSDKRLLIYDVVRLYPEIFCFSTTKYGGYSKGSYASFNCNSYCGDEITDVEKNKELLCRILPEKPAQLFLPHQIHETRILMIDTHFLSLHKDDQGVSLEGVDALVTSVNRICIAVSTADCVPVLCYDRRNHVVAAIHAGWRGTLARIVEKTLWEMNVTYGTCGTDVVVCIGPSISQVAFEVGDEVYCSFSDAQFDMHRIARNIGGRWHLDLWEANRLQLLSSGVPLGNIELAGICTYTENDTFFSARRQGINSGRILSGIMLVE